MNQHTIKHSPTLHWNVIIQTKSRFLSYFVLLLILLFTSYSCKKTSSLEDDTSSDVTTINLDPTTVYQEMDGFGASDAWSCQMVGKNWPLNKREEIADLLFSQDYDQNGDPKGIGLSIWRFNIGAGSMEQGNNSSITDPWKRVECFLSADGTYDWNKQAGQQWFLNAAKKRGVEKILMFSYSPPVYYTQNQKAYSAGGWHMNIQTGYMDYFADFLTSVVQHFNDEGTKIDYLSPVNEPQWNWSAGSNGQASEEGTPASNAEVADLTRRLSNKLSSKGLQTKVTLAEAGTVAYLYQNTDADRGNQIEDFFNSSSNDYVGNLSNVANLISSHSYYTVWPISDMISSREAVFNKISSVNASLKYWESEYCILEAANTDMADGWNRDLNMDMALYVGRLIHYALVKGNASSWQWWTALSRYTYKDGLIYLDDGSSEGINGVTNASNEDYCKNDGYIRQSKLLWGLGNYSLFVRPGMKRIYTGSPDILPNQSHGILASSFIDENTKKLVVVLINYSSTAKTVSINLKSRTLNGDFSTYVTSENTNLKKTKNVSAQNIPIQANSLTTLVGYYK